MSTAAEEFYNMMLTSGRGFMPRPSAGQQKVQGGVKAASGLADIISGKRNQRLAEENIEDIGAQQEELLQQYKDLSAPSLMDPNTVAAATRNAAILGGVPAQQDSSAEMAAAKMAMEAGADPATIQRNLANAQLQEQQMATQNAQQNFQQGLGMAQQDAQNQFARQQDNLMMDLDDVSAQLEAAQRESLMAQNQSQRGISGLVSGITQYGMGAQQQKALDKKNDTTNTNTETNPTEVVDPTNFSDTVSVSPFSMGGDYDPTGGYDPSTEEDPAVRAANMSNNILLQNSFAEGGTVQKTPGEFDHDTNDMILMAQTDGGLVDTGIRQTGGEFVLNPEQAEGLEEAYENVNRRKPTYEQLLALYEAARFLDEPQFDDDYVG